IRRFLAQFGGFVNQEESLAAFARAELHFLSQSARLRDFDEGAIRSHLRHVPARAGFDPAADRTLVATIQRIAGVLYRLSALTVGGFGECERELALAHAFGAGKDQRRAELSALEQALQNFLVAFVTDESGERHELSGQAGDYSNRSLTASITRVRTTSIEPAAGMMRKRAGSRPASSR